MDVRNIDLGKINRIVGVVALLAGSAALLGAGYFLHHTHLDEFLLPSAAVAQGQVIENRGKEVYPQGDTRELQFTAYQAIVRFSDQRGRAVTFADSISFNPPSFQVGQTVRVFYDPQQPQHAMIDRGQNNWVVPAIAGIFGGLMLLGGAQRLRRKGSASPALDSSS